MRELMRMGRADTYLQARAFVQTCVQAVSSRQPRGTSLGDATPCALCNEVATTRKALLMPVMPRDTIDPAYQWNLANIYLSDDVFLEALEEARAYPERIAAFQGSVAGSPQALLDYLRLDDEVSVELGKLANYAQRKSDEDTRVARYQDFSSQVTTLCVAVAGAQLKQLKFFADARRYPSTLDAALAGTEVPVEVYQNLLDSVHAHLDSMHDYAALRKRLLGVDELRFWDLYVPVVGDIDMRYTYEEACAIILEALQPLEDMTDENR